VGATFNLAASELVRAEAELKRARARGDAVEVAEAEERQLLAGKVRAQAIDAQHASNESTGAELRALDERIDSLDAAIECPPYLDERIDSLDAAIEWQDETVAELRLGAGDTDGEGTAQLGKVVETAAAHVSKELLKGYLPQLVDARRELLSREREQSAVRLQLAEAEERLRDQANSVELAEREFERRLAKQRQSAQLEKSSLLRQMRPAHPATSAESASSDGRGAEQLQRALREREEQVHALERDNFYFKQAARELKRQLHESSAGASAGDSSGGRRAQTADTERARLEAENQQLGNELANLKEYLLKNPSAQMVRVSKRDHMAALAPAAQPGASPRNSTGNTRAGDER